MSVYFIAEIGQNHQGDIRIAKQMVDTLVGSGVSAIKTAKRDIETCLTEEQKRMPYENPNSFGKTYYDHRKALELSHDEFEELKNYIEKNGFDFIPSFTDIPSFDLINKIGCEKIKIASQRVTDIKLLQHVANEFDGAVYMSSGMSNFDDINRMVEIFKSNEKYLLQCTSVYPCPENLLNLAVLHVYRKLYLGTVDGFGFSGHHVGIAADLCAYLFGAKIIERHFTLNRAWKGTDHAASLGIDGVRKIIKYIDQIDDAIGISDKYILPEELPAIKKLRGDLL
jgi:sialic acid synthase SpsE